MEKLRGERVVMYRYKVVQVRNTWTVLLQLDGLSVVLKTGKCPNPMSLCVQDFFPKKLFNSRGSKVVLNVQLDRLTS